MVQLRSQGLETSDAFRVQGVKVLGFQVLGFRV